MPYTRVDLLLGTPSNCPLMGATIWYCGGELKFFVAKFYLWHARWKSCYFFWDISKRIYFYHFYNVNMWNLLWSELFFSTSPKIFFFQKNSSSPQPLMVAPLYIVATVHFTALHYITLHYSGLHYTMLQYTSLPYSTLHYTIVDCTAISYFTLHCPTLHNTASTLHYSGLHYTML